MRNLYYKMHPVTHEVLPSNLMEMAELYETPGSRRVAQDIIGDVNISTVFLSIDHRFTGDGPPIVFETMVFGGKLDQEQWRYCTYDEAVKGHKNAVILVKRTQGTFISLLKQYVKKILAYFSA